MNEAHNMDCMEFLRKQPDKSFDLAVCDPPYGLSITGSTHTHTHTGASAPASRSEAKAIVWGAYKGDLSKRNFTRCLTMTPRQTPNTLGSWSASASTEFFSVAISFWITLVRRPVSSYGTKSVAACRRRTVRSHGRIYRGRAEYFGSGGTECCRAT